MGRYVIKKSFRGSIKMMLSCGIMLAASWYCITLSVATAIIGWIGMLFFGFCTITYIKQLFGSALIVLNDDGFQEYTSAVSGSFVSWSNVIDMKISGVMNQTFICVEIRNAEEYISKLSALKRKTAVFNQELGFATIQINLSMTNKTPQQILEKMTEYLNEYNKHSL